jgi:hypothetical protein
MTRAWPPIATPGCHGRGGAARIADSARLIIGWTSVAATRRSAGSLAGGTDGHASAMDGIVALRRQNLPSASAARGRITRPQPPPSSKGRSSHVLISLTCGSRAELCGPSGRRLRRRWPASAPGSASPRPVRRTPRHTRQRGRSACPIRQCRPVRAGAVILGSECPARGPASRSPAVSLCGQLR